MAATNRSASAPGPPPAPCPRWPPERIEASNPPCAGPPRQRNGRIVQLERQLRVLHQVGRYAGPPPAWGRGGTSGPRRCRTSPTPARSAGPVVCAARSETTAPRGRTSPPALVRQSCRCRSNVACAMRRHRAGPGPNLAKPRRVMISRRPGPARSPWCRGGDHHARLGRRSASDTTISSISAIDSPSP